MAPSSVPFPGWMMLDRFVRRRDADSFPAGDPTAASITNSRGDPFDVCLSFNEPPQPSTLSMRWANGPAEGEPLDPAAAHGGAVLLLMHYTVPVRGGLPFPMIHYLVYTPAGPSLRLLPPLGGTIDEVQARAEAEGLHLSKEMARRMESLDIGIIHRGVEDFVVAELQFPVTGGKTAPPELRVFNPSVSERWVLKLPRIVPVHPRDDLDMDRILWYWDTDAVVPCGTWLCWVDYTAGVMLYDVFCESSDILFLELPVKQPCIYRDVVGRGWLVAHNALGATKDAGGDVLKFAQVLSDDVPSPNGIIRPVYHDYPNRFVVTIWSLRLAYGSSMVWKKESAATADDLRDLVEFDDLPRELLMYPTFNLDNCDVVSFVLIKEDGTYGDEEIWLVAINMMKKTVKSSMLYIKNYDDCSLEEAELFERKIRYFEPFLPNGPAFQSPENDFSRSNPLTISDMATTGTSRSKISAPPGFSAPATSRASPPGFPSGFSSQDRLNHPPGFSSEFPSQDGLSPLPKFSSGFSSQDGSNPPPGFSSAFSTVFSSQNVSNQVLYGSTYPETQLHDNLVGSSINHYQPQSVRHTGDREFIDPAMLAVGKGMMPGVSDSGLDLKNATFPVQLLTSNSDLMLQLLVQQDMPSHQNLRFTDHIQDSFNPMNDNFMTSRLLPQNHDSLSSYAQMPPQRHRNSQHTIGQWNGWSDLRSGNNVPVSRMLYPTEANNFYMLGSNNLYNRAFGSWRILL